MYIHTSAGYGRVMLICVDIYTHTGVGCHRQYVYTYGRSGHCHNESLDRVGGWWDGTGGMRLGCVVGCGGVWRVKGEGKRRLGARECECGE